MKNIIKIGFAYFVWLSFNALGFVKSTYASSVNSLNIYGQSQLVQACLTDKFIIIYDLLNDRKTDVNLVEETTKNSPLHILVERAQYSKATEATRAKIEAIRASKETRESEEMKPPISEEEIRINLTKNSPEVDDEQILMDKIKYIQQSIQDSKEQKKQQKKERIQTKRIFAEAKAKARKKGGKFSFSDPRLVSNRDPRLVLAREKQDDEEQEGEVEGEVDELNNSDFDIIEIISNIIDQGLDFEAKTDSGWTALNKALYLASDLPDYPLEVPYLLLNKSKCKAINIPSRHKTPLHFAAGSKLEDGNRSQELVNMLIEICGNELNYQAVDKNGWTPYKVALAANNLTVARMIAQGQRNSFYSGDFALILISGITLILALLGFFFTYRYKRFLKNKINKIFPPKTRMPASVAQSGTESVPVFVTESVHDSTPEIETETETLNLYS